MPAGSIAQHLLSKLAEVITCTANITKALDNQPKHNKTTAKRLLPANTLALDSAKVTSAAFHF